MFNLFLPRWFVTDSVTYHIRRTLFNTTQKSCSIITCHGYWSLSSLLIVVVIVIDCCHRHWSPSSSLIVVTSSIVIVIVIVVLRPNYNCCSHIMNSQDENHNSHHNAEKMVKNIDWKCSVAASDEVTWLATWLQKEESHDGFDEGGGSHDGSYGGCVDNQQWWDNNLHMMVYGWWRQASYCYWIIIPFIIIMNN